MTNNKIIREIYQNNKLVNTFINQRDNIKSLFNDFYVTKFVNKTFRIQEKTNYTDHMQIIVTWYYYDCNMNKVHFKAIYKNLPCKGNRLDADKLMEIVQNES